MGMFKQGNNLKTVYKKKTSNSSIQKASTNDVDQKMIDAILDKISKSGYESLTKKEKEFLFQAGKNK